MDSATYVLEPILNSDVHMNWRNSSRFEAVGIKVRLQRFNILFQVRISIMMRKFKIDGGCE